MKDNFVILAIDTSCDDTSVAITEGRKILTNCVSSQIEMHKKTGGVIPIDAARAHEIILDPLIELALKRSGKTFTDINAIAVTYGPGLAPALAKGIEKAKILSNTNSIPLIPVNHMAGHAYANFAQNNKGNGAKSNDNSWPKLVLLISGGHTEIVLMKNHFDFKVIGETIDDACGECFDKVGRMLGLGYPAAPAMERFALEGNDKKYSLPRPMQNTEDFNVSYSGLKTATFRLIKSLADSKGINASSYLTEINEDTLDIKVENNISTGKENKTKAPPGTQVFLLSRQEICDICASFQKAAVDTILIKLNKALEAFPVTELILGGGVVKNKLLRKEARKLAYKYKIKFNYPRESLIPDNAGMIGIAGYYEYYFTKKVLFKEKDINSLERTPGLRLE